jgi:hypothetical protein
MGAIAHLIRNDSHGVRGWDGVPGVLLYFTASGVFMT